MVSFILHIDNKVSKAIKPNSIHMPEPHSKKKKKKVQFFVYN